MVTNCRFTHRRLFFVAEHGIEEQQDAANHNGGIGNIEVRPVVVNDVHFEKIDNVAEAQASYALPIAPARMSARPSVVAVILRPSFSNATSTATAATTEKISSNQRTRCRRTGIVEQAERRAWVLHVADGEDMGNHLHVAAESQSGSTPAIW